MYAARALNCPKFDAPSLSLPFETDKNKKIFRRGSSRLKAKIKSDGKIKGMKKRVIKRNFQKHKPL